MTTTNEKKKRKPYFWAHLAASMVVTLLCFHLVYLKRAEYVDVESTIKHIWSLFAGAQAAVFGAKQWGKGLIEKAKALLKG